MSRVKVNNITPFAGQNITLGGHALPSGSKNLGSETNPWAELYVSTGSVNFVSTVTLGQPTVIVASIKARGEAGVSGGPTGMIFTDTGNNNLLGSFSVGKGNTASGTASLAVGNANISSGTYSYAQGVNNRASGLYSHAQGVTTSASGFYSHAEGAYTKALGQQSHAEGSFTVASGSASHAEGDQTLALGDGSHAEGYQTTASGVFSHAEGFNTIASGQGAHAEGSNTIASGQYSHAEGLQNLASGNHSHAQGYLATASGNNSFASGLGVVASSQYQVVVGQYNNLNNTSSIFVVGAGVSNSRKDGFSVESDGTKAHIVIPANQQLPNNPKQGSMFFNQDTNMLYIHNGTAWRSASFA